jgi:hypothetical protein
MERRNLLMIRRITILVMALMIALSMALGAAGAAFGDPDCAKVPNNKNCVLVGPGKSETTPAATHNPNVHDKFTPPGRS